MVGTPQRTCGLGVTHLDMLVVTNYDEDHVSGLAQLRKWVNIGWLWRNKSVTPDILATLKSEDGMGAGIAELTSMMRNYTGDGTAQPPIFANVERRAFHLDYPEFDDENNLSFVVFLKIAGIGFLFPGDLETKGWSTLLARDVGFRKVASQVNVLIASHHGRENGKSTVLFEEQGCNPYWVVISDKGYEHETQETMGWYSARAKGGRFRERDRSVLTTRFDGHIHFWLKGGQWGAS